MKKTIINILIFILIIITFSSCNPKSGYPSFELNYSPETGYDEVLQTTGGLVKLLPTINNNVFYHNPETESADILIMENVGFDDGFVLKNNDLDYIIAHDFNKNKPEYVMPVLHRKSIVFIPSENNRIINFDKGQFPLVINENSIYYFEGASIYKMSLSDRDDVVLMGSVNDKDEIGKIKSEIFLSKNDPNPSKYIFDITDNGISVLARVRNKNFTGEMVSERTTLLLEIVFEEESA